MSACGGRHGLTCAAMLTAVAASHPTAWGAVHHNLFYRFSGVFDSSFAAHGLWPSTSVRLPLALQVFRGLRLWHAHPTPCSSCHQPLGSYTTAVSFVCASCSRSFPSYQGYAQHCRGAGHAMHVDTCTECGRLHHLKQPLTMEPASTSTAVASDASTSSATPVAVAAGGGGWPANIWQAAKGSI